jgi:hypothetical protein
MESGHVHVFVHTCTVQNMYVLTCSVQLSDVPAYELPSSSIIRFPYLNGRYKDLIFDYGSTSTLVAEHYLGQIRSSMALSNISHHYRAIHIGHPYQVPALLL